MSQRRSFNAKEILAGFKTILSRNALLIIAIDVMNRYASSVKGGLRGLVATRELGLTASIVGTAVSVCTIIQIFTKAPTGRVLDTARSKMKVFLSVGLILKIIVIMGFAVVKGSVGYYALYVLDGIVDAITLTAIPTILALVVDRKAMGSAYAVMMAIERIVTASARQVAIGTYNNSGLVPALSIGAGLCAACLICTLLLDSKPIIEANQKAGIKDERKAGKGLLISMLPLCLIVNMAQASINFDSQYMALYSDAVGFKYLDISTIGGSITGILTLFIGVLCDFINPAFVLGGSMLGLGVCIFGWSFVNNFAVIRATYFAAFFFRSLSAVGAIVGMKAVSKAEQGSFQATNGTCASIMTTIVTPVLGFMIDGLGYQKTLWALSAFVIISFLLFLVVYKVSIKKMIENSPQEG